MEQPPDFVAEGGVTKGVQVEKICVSIDTVTKSLFWMIFFLFGILVFLVLRRITLCFGDNIEGRSYFL